MVLLLRVIRGYDGPLRPNARSAVIWIVRNDEETYEVQAYDLYWVTIMYTNGFRHGCLKSLKVQQGVTDSKVSTWRVYANATKRPHYVERANKFPVGIRKQQILTNEHVGYLFDEGYYQTGMRLISTPRLLERRFVVAQQQQQQQQH